MKSYIVRIYRRDKDDLSKLVGLVEIVGLEENKAFKNFEELWGILTSPGWGKSQIGRSIDWEEGKRILNTYWFWVCLSCLF